MPHFVFAIRHLRASPLEDLDRRAGMLNCDSLILRPVRHEERFAIEWAFCSQRLCATRIGGFCTATTAERAATNAQLIAC